MILLTDNETLLDVLSAEHYPSPEEFLIHLEELLELGELTEDEVAEILASL